MICHVQVGGVVEVAVPDDDREVLERAASVDERRNLLRNPRPAGGIVDDQALVALDDVRVARDRTHHIPGEATLDYPDPIPDFVRCHGAKD